VPSSIATLAELKSYLDTTRTSDDTLLQSILDGVSGRVERYTGRLFHPDPPLVSGLDTAPAVTSPVYLPRRALKWGVYCPRTRTVDIPEAREIDTVAAAAATVSGFTPLGENPWERIQVFGVTVPWQNPVTALPAITVTGRFGLWPAPDDIKDAVLVMSARRWKERDAGYGDTVQFAEGVTVAYFRQFPATVQATIESYVRRKIALP
jgi:hypothetical protein